MTRTGPTSAKHASPEWRRTVRTIRAQVRQAYERGEPVMCWRHGDEIPEGVPFDVGHLQPLGGEGIDNAAPECRRGNRSHGGRMGAAKTNAKRSKASTFRPLPWA
ncbi:hypothetical protein [Microbacterium sp. MTN4-26]|uniref:hypothetical protein n=1 Tax=unclassified Microbacterium TaxID=2609290 RepID=UPI0036F4072C